MYLSSIVLVCFILCVFCSMSEALISIRKETNTTGYQTTIQFFILLCAMISGSLLAQSFIPLLSLPEWLTYGIVLILWTDLFVLVGIRLPQRIVHTKPEKKHSLLHRFFPVLYIIGSLLTFFIRIDTEKKKEAVSEEEIVNMIDSAPQKELIENVFAFDDTNVEEICTHRSDVVMLYLNETSDQWAKTIKENRHTFYPVCGKDEDDVVGVVDTRDYFRLDRLDKNNVITHAMDEPFFVSENTMSDDLFHEMKRRRNYFAIVIDEYGGMTGIITLHDLIEALLGSIDEEDEPQINEIVKIDENQWWVYGSAAIEDVEKALHIKIDTDDYDTFGGYLLGCYGHLPDDGTQFRVELDQMVVFVKELKNHRILKTIVHLKERDENKNESTEASH